MKKWIVLVITFLFAWLTTSAGIYAILINEQTTVVTPNTLPVTPPPLPNPTIAELLQLVNEERAKVGVAPLRLDNSLNTSAQLKAESMERENRFEHVDNNGKQGYSYIDDVGKHCIYRSENLTALPYSPYDFTSEGAVKGWITSPSHYTAMVDPRYDSTGFGIGKYSVVQHFCDE